MVTIVTPDAASDSRLGLGRPRPNGRSRRDHLLFTPIEAAERECGSLAGVVRIMGVVGGVTARRVANAAETIARRAESRPCGTPASSCPGKAVAAPRALLGVFR